MKAGFASERLTCIHMNGIEICGTTNIKATTATEKTKLAFDHCLNYCSTHLEAKNIYQASGMHLQINIDATYLVAPNAISRARGYHFLGNKDGKLFNGAIVILAKIIKAVMTPAAEVKCGSLCAALRACSGRVNFTKRSNGGNNGSSTVDSV